MSGRRELAIGAAGYAAYLAARAVVWTDEGRARALANSHRVIALERRLGLLVEPAVQAASGRARRLVTALNLGYGVANVTLSIGWLFWLYGRRDPDFLRERRAVLVAWSGAIPVFTLFPLAPPRKVDGFTDTLLAQGIDLERPELVRWYNPIAAMPSYHMAFPVAGGLGLPRRSRTGVGRVLGRAYPLVVAVTVVATGNHYVADVAAGSALGVVARGLARWVDRRAR